MVLLDKSGYATSTLMLAFGPGETRVSSRSASDSSALEGTYRSRSWAIVEDEDASRYQGTPQRHSNPNTPWDWHIYLHWGGFRGQCRHIYGSPMECLGKAYLFEQKNEFLMVCVTRM